MISRTNVQNEFSSIAQFATQMVHEYITTRKLGYVLRKNNAHMKLTQYGLVSLDENKSSIVYHKNNLKKINIVLLNSSVSLYIYFIFICLLIPIYLLLLKKTFLWCMYSTIEVNITTFQSSFNNGDCTKLLKLCKVWKRTATTICEIQVLFGKTSCYEFHVIFGVLYPN